MATKYEGMDLTSVVISGGVVEWGAMKLVSGTLFG